MSLYPSKQILETAPYLIKSDYLTLLESVFDFANIIVLDLTDHQKQSGSDLRSIREDKKF